MSRVPTAGSLEVTARTAAENTSPRLPSYWTAKHPRPNGTVVLLRCVSTDLTMPSAARVAVGQTSGAVTAAAVAGASTATIHVSSRTIYQLTDPPASTTLTITVHDLCTVPAGAHNEPYPKKGRIPLDTQRGIRYGQPAGCCRGRLEPRANG